MARKKKSPPRQYLALTLDKTGTRYTKARIIDTPSGRYDTEDLFPVNEKTGKILADVIQALENPEDVPEI